MILCNFIALTWFLFGNANPLATAAGGGFSNAPSWEAIFSSGVSQRVQQPGVVKYERNNNDDLRKRRSVFHVRWNPNEKYIVESKEKPAVNRSKLSPHPRFALSKNTKLTLDPKMFMCHDRYSDRCQNKTKIFRNRILNSFRKSMGEVINETNYYNVEYKRMLGNFDEIYYPSACLLMEAGVRVLRRRDPPFNKLEFGKLFPKKRIFKDIKKIQTCAIVSSAGSMAGSNLGDFIDAHDIVMRFNHAPVRGYESDVGKKTTIRVVNSQVVTKSEFNFVKSRIFQNVTIAAWDPGKYNGTLKDWLTTADFDLFTNYENFRRKYPQSRAYLIDPHSIWRLWQGLQTFSSIPIRKNPPSSGFIGLALLLPHCPYIDIIEYIPSTRLNGRCHYYSKEIQLRNIPFVHTRKCLPNTAIKNDKQYQIHAMNSACTFGAWHPLAAEKLMALDMNIAEDFLTFQNGIVRIRRPDRLLCGFNFLGF